MPRCRAVAYLVEVRELNASSKSNLKFGSFDGSTDLRSVMLGYLRKMNTYSKVAHFQKTFKVKLDKVSNTGPITGMIYAGDYGQISDIIDSNSGKTSYTKTKTDSLTTPFYFHLELPPKETRGILCLQQFGLSGAKSLLVGALTGQFESFFPDYRLHVRSLTLADALKDYLKGGVVEEIIVEKLEIPADIADAFGGVKQAQPGTFSYSIKPSNSLFRKDGLIAFANGTKELADVFEFGEHGFDVVKAKIRVGGELRPVNLTKPDAIATSFDITDYVKMGPNGFPTPASLASEFKKIVDETAKRGGIVL
jgi:hypothetical protein